MMNRYTRSIKYISKVKSLISILVKDFFATVNLEIAAKSVVSASMSGILIKNSKKTIVLFTTCLLMLVGAGNVSGATRTSTATGGAWATPGTWVGGVAPATGDVVIIATTGANSVTVGANLVQTAAGSVTVNSGATLTLSNNVTLTFGAMTILSGGTVNVSRAMTVLGATNITGTINLQTTARAYAFNGDVTLNSGANWNETVASTPTFAGNFTNNATTFTASTGAHTFSGATRTISGTTTTTIPSATISGNYTNNGTLTVGTLLTVTGAAVVFTNNGTVTATTALSGTGKLTQGTTGVLNLGGTSLITTLDAATNAGNTVNYNGAAQTVMGTTYNNLTLSGSGTKTLGTATTTNGTLTVNSGVSLAMSTFLLTLNGDLVNNGVAISGGTGGVTIAGIANQGIDGFTTTGTVSMTKTSGTATFHGNVNGGAFTLSGSGGTLDLGAGFTHTFTGAWTRTNGTLLGNSSTLNIGGTTTNTAGTFTAGSSTVNYNGGAQTIANVVYNNLTLSGGGVKTFPAGTTTVNGVLSIENGANANTFTGTLAYGANATLQYNTPSNRTAGAEWISPFVATGGIIIANTGIITMNSAEIFNSTAPLTINSGANLAMSTFLLTLNGNFINNGGTTSGSGGVLITGTSTQSIGSFTTTGTVSMTKTAGIATLQGNVNGAGLMINGAGGTLNLGSGLTHTFTGVITLTAGTLNGGSSTLNENATSATAWNGTGTVFTPGTGTVNFGGAAQTLSASATSFNNLTFSGSGVKTIGSITINNGGILTSNNLALTFVGDFINNGVDLNAGSSPITISGVATQSIDGFTTTGLVSMTKTGGIATLQGNVNGAGLTINGAGGTLNLGSGLTHTFTGTWTRTNGTLNGGSSLLRLGGTFSGALGTFTANAGTVEWYAAGAQTIATLVYYNLVLSGSGAKSISAGTSIAANLSISGATASVAAGQNISVGSLTLGGFNKTSGTWGSTFSSAVNQTNTYFAATTGYVTVTSDTRPIPTFSGITASQSICFGTPVVILSGTVSAAGPVYPVNGETVGVTINGVLQNTTIAGGAGGFSINFNSATIPVGSPYTITYSYAGGTNLTAAVNNTSTTLTVSNAKTPTTTGSLICIGSTATLTASGAIAGDKYFWYDAASGGTLLKPSTDNNDNTYTTAVLAATTNYWVSIMNAGGCEGPRTQVIATFPSVSTDDQNAVAVDSWIGHVYDGTNFNTYYGHYTELETFNENFGSGTNCLPILSNSLSRSINTQDFSIKYRMNSTKRGLYVADLGWDDGTRLTVDGVLVYNDWVKSSWPPSNPGVLMNLSGTSNLLYEYYGGGGANGVLFQNLTQVLGNTLTTNTTQTILLGNAGAIISGDVYGTLPTGVSLSGTGYQWTYSTTPGGARTNITGATGATLTPSNAIAPFNTAGTYYVYRNAILSSVNNVAPNPYVATNESNVATITIAAPGVSTSVSSLTGFSYVVGSGPSAEQSLNVVGIGLLGNITVTPPADFEVSVLSGGVFQTTPLTLTAVGGVVNTTVYVRMKQGLTVGGYNSENIVLSAAGFTSKDVSCSGIVIPGVTAGGGGSYCAGGTINLTSSPSPTNITLTNVYWTGPNSFYSTDPKPSIPTATTAMSGTYTVTGNYVPAINLLVNGDFETGTNLGITTNYQYVAPSSTALSTGGTHGATGGEGNYTVVGNPKDVHSNFSNCSPNGNYQMVVNGSKQDLETVWGQTVTNLEPNTNYQFTYYVQSVTTDNPSMLQLYVNGSKAGGVYTANAATCVTKQFVYNWNSGASTTAVLTLVNRQTQVGGNDFALDDIVFQPVYTSSASVNVSVLAAAAPASVSIAASPGSSVNSGTSVTFTATPVNGGTLPVYQWQVNGVNKGTNSPIYTYIPTDGNTVTCTMTSSSQCLVTPDPVTSNTITMAVNNPPNYWKGAYGTNWGNPANWTAGYIPGIGDNIIFSTVSTSGDALNNLILDKDRIIGNLTNLSSKKLIIQPAKCLTVNGTITTDGDANKIYIQAWPDGTQQNGSLIFHNDVSSPVYASVEMYSKATRDPLGVFDPVTNKTYYYSWQYFGIPLRVVVADPTFYGSFVRRNDEASTNNLGKWLPLTNLNELTSFTGYEITQDAPTTFVFQGALENGDKSIALPYTSGAYDPGQTILANPYTAAIDVRQLIFGDNTEKTVYLYNTGSFGQWADKNGETTNDTTTITPGQYIAIPQRVAASIGLPNDIPSMSGFLVKATNATGGSLIINYSSVITKNVNPQRAPQLAQASDQVYLQITLKGKNYGDRVWLVDEPGTSHGFDNGWDGYKLFGAVGTPKLFVMENDANYQISTTDNMNNTYLGFQAGVDLEDTLTFRSANIAARYSAVYLVDLIENKVIDITKPGTQYTFKAVATTAPIKRFKVVTQPLDANPANSAPQLKVFNDNNIVFVNNPTDQKGELYFYDIMGRFLKKEPFGPNGISAFPLFSATGAYIVKTVTSTEQVSKKIIIK